MTDKTPKLLVDALDAIGSAKDFVDGCTLANYAEDKMRRSCPTMTRRDRLELVQHYAQD
jgi:hypothetical protein